MSQSSIIFFVLLLAFVVFVTQKGELPVYLGLLLLSPAQQTASINAGQAVQAAQTVAPLFIG